MKKYAKYSRVVYFFVMLLSLSGCGLSVSESPVSDISMNTSVTGDSQLTGFAAGGKIQTTTGGYQVVVVAGDSIATEKLTSAGGYVMYSNVTGNIASQ